MTTSTPEYGFPLPPDTSKISAFPAVMRALSTTLEAKLGIAARKALRGERLPAGSNLDAIDVGEYSIISAAEARTMLGRPVEGVAAQAAHLVVRSSTLSGAMRVQRWQITPAASDRPLVWERHLDSAGVWSVWQQMDGGAYLVPSGADVYTLTPGRWSVPNATTARTLTNRPPAGLAAQAATVDVQGAGHAITRTVRWTIAPNKVEPSVTWVCHRDTAGGWSPWTQEGPSATTLIGGEDIRELSPGPYVVPSFSVASTLLNRPTGSLAWGQNPSTITVTGSESKTRTIVLRTAPNAAEPSRMLVMHRDNAGSWSPWQEPSPPTSTAPTGEAALPTLAPLAAVQHDAARTAVRLMAGTLAADHPARWTAPAGTKLTIPTPDGTGQAVHPKVLDTGTPGFGGFRYWMAMTPYAWANDALEDPCLLVSQDGTAWQAAPGAPTPLDDQPGSPEHYNSDTHLVLRDGTMYAVWRTSKNGAAPDRISWRTSTDGKTWTPARIIYEGGGVGTVYGQMVSPALIRTPTGWRMYLVAVNAHPNRMIYVTTTAATPTPADWSAPVRCAIDGGDQHIPGRDVWHIDVVQDGGGYLALINDCLPRTGGIDGDLILARSADGTTWTSGRGPLLPRYAAHHDALYRGTLIPREDGTIDVWYSARVKQNQRWTISRTLAQKDC